MKQTHLRMRRKLAKLNDRVKHLERTLLIVETLTFFHEDLENKLNGDIYQMAHLGLGWCEGCKKRDVKYSFESRASQHEVELKELNICDVQKTLAERHEK